MHRLPPAVASATYDAANQQLSFAGQPLAYDANGNLLTQGELTYTWDARNRLVAISGPSLLATFQYDPAGRRTQKTINGVTTQYVYDGPTPVQELGDTGSANLLTGTGIDEYFTRTDADGRRTFFTDVLGSTVALTDDTGTVVTQYTYDPFGATTITGALSANPFQYTGRENDGPTGLYYYRARYYSPPLHRFIAEDQIDVTPWDTNLYAYVGNDPLGFVDPTGNSPAAALAVSLLVLASFLIRLGIVAYCSRSESRCQTVGDTVAITAIGVFAMLAAMTMWLLGIVNAVNLAEGKPAPGGGPPPDQDAPKGGGSDPGPGAAPKPPTAPGEPAPKSPAAPDEKPQGPEKPQGNERDVGA